MKEDEALVPGTSNPIEAVGAPTGKRPRALEDERGDLEGKVAAARKRLKLQASFDTTYWTNAMKVAERELALNDLKRKISIKSMNTTHQEWSNSIAGQWLLLKHESFLMDCKIAQEQLDRNKIFEKRFGMQKASAGLFIGSPIGWGFANSRGKRDSVLQSAFRAELIERQKSIHPDPDKELLWCPVTSEYWVSSATVAGHLFPWKAGPEAMESIFDEQDTSELFKAENGILWSQEAEVRFSAGHLCIVPNVPNEPTIEEITAWEVLEVKEYKVRILNFKHPTMGKKIGLTEKKWFQLDNARVSFQGNFRPRARYLYFAYCEAMLRRAYAGKHFEVAHSEHRQRFWDTPGRYVLGSILRGFVNAMGHDYSHLLEGGIESLEEDDGETDVRGTLIANEHIQDSLEEEDGDESSDDDDEIED
ncbi:MAG: hypothetical protein LQ343_002791 [Gyalolechia ehrenbergii]|nr:MAG: hypothetical protein LQ343_002791 [Gyalolechia ehrenbergii]